MAVPQTAALIKECIEQGVLMTPSIKRAFITVDRADFVVGDLKGFAYADTALPIGFKQTISQPYVVARMIEQLDPVAGDRILDIGSGSGWTSTLLAHIVSSKNLPGKVIALEIIPQLKDFGEKNALPYGYVQQGILQFACQDGSSGYPRMAPYDKILVSAALGNKKLIHKWKDQVIVHGKIVAPIGNSIWVFTKQDDGSLQEKEIPGFMFVPFVNNNT